MTGLEDVQPAPRQTPAEPARKKPAMLRWLLGAVGVAVAVVLLTVALYKAAEAFSWEPVLQAMRPVAGLLGIGGEEDPWGPGSVEAALEESCTATGQPVQYATLDEAPDMLYGYPIRPRGLPERLTYLQGSAFCDGLNTSVTHVFLGDEGVCVFSVLILRDIEQSTTRAYEQVPGNGEEWYIGGCPVNFYYNSDDATLSATWVKDLTQYSIFGSLTMDEIKVIIDRTMTR